jgi:small multidrug resistance pump
MPWLLLTFAILLEVAGTTSMKLANGFEHRLPSILVFVFYALSFTMMVLALKKLELSIAYAIWAGAGTALIAIIGVVWFGEPVTAVKVGSLVLIVVGVVGLQMSSGA